MKTRFYYTLAESLKLSDDPLFDVFGVPWFMYIITDPISGQNVGGLGYYVNSLLGRDVIVDDSYTKTVMQKYIWPTFYEENIFYIDVEHPSYETPEKPSVISGAFAKVKKKTAGKIWSWVESSRLKYSKLVELYTAQAGNLLNQIKSNSVSKFNDTPQAAASGGFTGDNYTSNITQNESGTDGDSIINRLDEVRRKLNSIYEDWAKEFEAFIISEE